MVSVDTVVLIVGEIVNSVVIVVLIVGEIVNSVVIASCVVTELSEETLVLKGMSSSMFEVNTGKELLTEVDNDELTIVVNRVSDDEGVETKATELDGVGCTGLEIALAADVRTGKDVLSIIDLNEEDCGEGFEEVIKLVTVGEEVTVDMSGTKSI